MTICFSESPKVIRNLSLMGMSYLVLLSHFYIWFWPLLFISFLSGSLILLLNLTEVIVLWLCSKRKENSLFITWNKIIKNDQSSTLETYKKLMEMKFMLWEEYQWSLKKDKSSDYWVKTVLVNPL